MISMIIPCHNEEGVLRKYPEIFFPHFKDLEVEYLFIDDGSTDLTSAVIRSFPPCYDCHQWCHLTRLGVGHALKNGISWATGDPIVTIDADLSYSPQTIRAMLDRYWYYETDADCISASPYVDKNLIEGVSWYRWMISMGGNYLYRMVVPDGITCFSSIARVYRAGIIKSLNLVSEGFELNNEIMVRLLRGGAKVIEVPAVLHQRKYGESKVSVPREMVRNLALLWRMRG